jgi:hypothetical protein
LFVEFVKETETDERLQLGVRVVRVLVTIVTWLAAAALTLTTVVSWLCTLHTYRGLLRGLRRGVHRYSSRASITSVNVYVGCTTCV